MLLSRCILSVAVIVMLSDLSRAVEPNSTYCNPLNLSYYKPGSSSREAADPSIVQYKGDWYMAVSKSMGYWYSSDLLHWTYVAVTLDDIPTIMKYAPTLWIDDGKLYYTGKHAEVYSTSTPKVAGSWKRVGGDIVGGDPMVFIDGDGAPYHYEGLGTDIQARKLARSGETYAVEGSAPKVILDQPLKYGWEQRYIELDGVALLKPASEKDKWAETGLVEGPWMTKHNGTYYLQYASPGTEWKVYSDGVYTADNPMGPFTYAKNSPVSHKPSGFVGGAGHGCTFTDMNGNYWRAVTHIVSVNARFERRLGMYPAGFDNEGLLHTNTYLGDFPQYAPGKNPNQHTEYGNLVGWMLLSYGKKVESSSNNAASALANIVDEDIRTSWTATGDSGEWVKIDLGKECSVHALQINFYGKTRSHRYVAEGSLDGVSWNMLYDKSADNADVPHDYVQLSAAAEARYIKLTSVSMGADLCLCGLRVFGSANGSPPSQAPEFSIQRNADDPRWATITWTKVDDATGYVMRWGISPTKLYNNHQAWHDENSAQVKNGSQLTIWYLNVDDEYYFTVDAFNENGVTLGTTVKSGKSQPTASFISSSYFSAKTSIAAPQKHLSLMPIRMRNGFLYELNGRVIPSVINSRELNNSAAKILIQY